jgi:NAD(P)-dependent dehydrogenase (short-subunit alcohol dehydrogenase family)
MMSNELRNRTVVITGASAGVGRAAAHRFARAGARVAMIARDKDALNDVKNEIERLGGTGFVAPADVADSNQVFLAADSILHEFGPFDIWINDAMVTVFSPMWDMTPAEFRRVTEVTYLGMVHGTMAALRHAAAQSGYHHSGRLCAGLSRRNPGFRRPHRPGHRMRSGALCPGPVGRSPIT